MNQNKKILLWLLQNGFKLSKKGIEFLVDAVEILHYNKKMKCTDIYEILSGQHETTYCAVVRAMSHAIEKDWSQTTFVKYAKNPRVFEAVKLLEMLYDEWE